jgi:hypothetical protein
MNDKSEVTDLKRGTRERVYIHGQVETCSCVLLNARNGLSPGISLSNHAYVLFFQFLITLIRVYGIIIIIIQMN